MAFLARALIFERYDSDEDLDKVVEKLAGFAANDSATSVGCLPSKIELLEARNSPEIASSMTVNDRCR
jgi:hypothetical protein